MTTANFNLRLDNELKTKSFNVIESFGLTPSQAIRLLLKQIADTGSLPITFENRIKQKNESEPPISYEPNATTLRAIQELEQGIYTESSLAELLKSKRHA